MAAGEYISVKSQEDIEKADLKFEEQELKSIRSVNWTNSPKFIYPEA